jgi:hypothetical protein
VSSIQSRIVDFVVGTSCLAYATGKPSGLVVGRGTAVPVQEANHPRIDVYVGPERTQAVGAWHGDPKERWVTLLLECRAVGVGISPDLALDPLKVWAEKRIYADETFGGIGAGISGWSTDQDTRQLDKTYGLATLAVEVRYITSRDDPESQT